MQDLSELCGVPYDGLPAFMLRKQFKTKSYVTNTLPIFSAPPCVNSAACWIFCSLVHSASSNIIVSERKFYRRRNAKRQQSTLWSTFRFMHFSLSCLAHHSTRKFAGEIRLHVRRLGRQQPAVSTPGGTVVGNWTIRTYVTSDLASVTPWSSVLIVTRDE